MSFLRKLIFTGSLFCMAIAVAVVGVFAMPETSEDRLSIISKSKDVYANVNVLCQGGVMQDGTQKEDELFNSQILPSSTKTNSIVIPQRNFVGESADFSGDNVICVSLFVQNLGDKNLCVKMANVVVPQNVEVQLTIGCAFEEYEEPSVQTYSNETIQLGNLISNLPKGYTFSIIFKARVLNEAKDANWSGNFLMELETV